MCCIQGWVNIGKSTAVRKRAVDINPYPANVENMVSS
jgi:hypothetical protein